jgi:hypothetical protein
MKSYATDAKVSSARYLITIALIDVAWEFPDMLAR